ncbi:transketolase [Clostridioides difficile]|nr:transketolase [Clostridioides difficile]EKS6833404.1 transketolase [Clostridioides difficile]MBY2254416.1 transketolase [Clostridioides difficile]MCI2385168.1 transketolase [Clostridioides difficile]MCR1370675.1 transketolase [Clostridioides difficile]
MSTLRDHSNNIRKNIIKMVAEAKSGHPGGSLSIADMLTVLYFDKMNVCAENPKMADRDRFVLSKGHAAPALYATLAEKGFFPEEELITLRKFGSKLQGHPDMKKVAGIDMSTGSLGQGLSAANGMALAGKLDNKDYTVYTILGDGEIQEGQIWEAAMTASHYKLDNLIAFVDLNGLQIDGSNEEVMNVNPVDDKFKSFGWNVIVINGHSFEEIGNAVDEAKKVTGKPTVIIAKTVKGKGVSFMENNAEWHGTAPNAEQAEQALKDLEGGL